MKHAVYFVVAAALIALCSNIADAQYRTAPYEVVRYFKGQLDASNVSGMLYCYWDPEVDAPLQSYNAPRMVETMETFIQLWKGLSFTLQKQVVVKGVEVVVYMYNAETRQLLKFLTNKLSSEWYIKDTEYYFNVDYVGGERLFMFERD